MSDNSGFADLFPRAVRFCVSLTPPARPLLEPAEQKLAAAMAPGRLLQFAHGRSCARRALAGLGVEPCAIGVGAQREPVWPDGITGSISHCEHRAAAAVGRADHLLGIGVDLEESGPLPTDILDLICTPYEAARLARLPVNYGRLLFSAKESVFKCIWPVVRRFVDFAEISVSLPASGQQFKACSSDLALGSLLAELNGRFTEVDGAWLTSAWIERGPGRSASISR